MNYICLNGEILPDKHAQLSLNNRAFRFGEGVVEEMRSSGIRVPFFKHHFTRATHAFRLLGLSHLSSFTEESLLRTIELLIHRKKLYNINKVTMIFWREDDVSLLSNNEHINYYIEVEPLDEKAFILNEKGLVATIFKDGYKGLSFLNPYNYNTTAFKLLAMRFAKEQHTDVSLITNAEGKIIEEADANVFFVSGKTIYTPSVSTGCVDGIMRKVVLEIFEKAGFIVAETDPLQLSFIFEVDEIFLANDVYGIRWIGGYKHKRYRKKSCVDLVYQLNQLFENNRD